MKFTELFSVDELAHEISEGFVRSQVHPTQDLMILNYTEKAQFAKRWNKVTLNCRGLIVHSDTHEIVARPFPKFFNYGEGDAHLDLDALAIVSDKIDGSLGIMYQTADGRPLFATRGSFASDQAKHATATLQAKYSGFRPPSGLTLLFEIVYPENRIVVDYQGQDDLVLIGAMGVNGGVSYTPGEAQLAAGWSGPVAEVFPYETLREALTAPLRPGKEGLVVHLVETDTRVKLKQDDYVELHRIVTGLNTKAIWERVGNAMLTAEEGEDWFSTVLADIPDELHAWVETVARDMVCEYRDMRRAALNAWYAVTREVGLITGDTTTIARKEFALMANTYNPWIKTCLFLILDNRKDKAELFLWKQLEPKGDVKR